MFLGKIEFASAHTALNNKLLELLRTMNNVVVDGNIEISFVFTALKLGRLMVAQNQRHDIQRSRPCLLLIATSWHIVLHCGLCRTVRHWITRDFSPPPRYFSVEYCTVRVQLYLVQSARVGNIIFDLRMTERFFHFASQIINRSVAVVVRCSLPFVATTNNRIIVKKSRHK